MHNRLVADSSDDKSTTPAGDRPLASDRREDIDTDGNTKVEHDADADSKLLLSAATVKLRAQFFEDRYEYKSALGRGGMGEVSAFADKRMGREVAVKLALPDPDQDRAGREAFTARFIHEARVQARIEHPAVVPVYDLGLTSAKKPYFTMKRVRGLTLEQVIDGLAAGDEEITGRFNRRRLLTAFSQVCLAVDFAHSRGVIHRDLKPANLMFGDFGEVYVLDWGIAATTHSGTEPNAPGRSAVIGVSGGGTVGYMAPERLEGDDDGSDASDIYGLGAILYELLTHQPLNPGSTPQARGVATLEGDQPPPSERAPELEIPPELDVICMRATALRPAQRYSSARRLADAVDGYLDGVRDEALRSELAQQYTAAASEAADRLLLDAEGTIEERSEVLRDLGRALALDPDNEVARETMVRLLTTPPPVAPPQVLEEQERAAAQRRMWAGKAAVVAYLSFLLYWPLFVWAGARDWTPLIAYSVLSTVSAVLCFVAAYRRGGKESWVVAAMLVSSVAVGSTAMLYGPFVLLPAAIATNAAAYTMIVSRPARVLTTAAALAAIAIPLALDWLGVIAPFYRFEGGEMTIVAHSIEFSTASSMAVMLAASVGSVLTGTLTMGALKKTLDRAERQLLMYTWHFRQLAPGTTQTRTPVATP